MSARRPKPRWVCRKCGEEFKGSPLVDLAASFHWFIDDSGEHRVSAVAR